MTFITFAVNAHLIIFLSCPRQKHAGIIGGVRLVLLRFCRFNDKLYDKKHNKKKPDPVDTVGKTLSPKVELIQFISWQLD